MIIVDSRERHITELLPQDAVRVQCLSVADFLLTDADGNVQLAIERKTIADLSASLVDGRFHEQRSRIKQAYGDRVAFLIEGDLDHSDTKLSGAITGLAFRHNIHVVRTTNVRDTTAFLLNASRSAEKGRLVECSSDAAPPCHAPRSKAGTPAELAMCMLQAIPGVSPKIASNIIKEHASMAGVIKAVNADRTLMHHFKVGARKLGRVGDRITEILSI